METPSQENPRSPKGFSLCLALAVALILVGCGNPGEGSAKLDPGLRARLGTGPMMKSSAPAQGLAKGRRALPEVSGIKSRMNKGVQNQ
jgi:hypothetical protein